MTYETKILSAVLKDGTFDFNALNYAADLLKAGEAVAIPTETVYGLAADALNSEAVSKIYEAKNRPSGNPLIVHIASIEQARNLVIEFTPWAEKLAKAFWPGPLTIILKKQSKVPAITTGGNDTIALRMPDHPVALEILNRANLTVAAPSANLSNTISPTRASHVWETLQGRIPLIIDGGLCQTGIESTIVKETEEGKLQVLRPGIITPDMLSQVTGLPTLTPRIMVANNESIHSPGSYQKHYSPTTPFLLVKKEESEEIFRDLVRSGNRVGWMRQGGIMINSDTTQIVSMPDTPEGYSKKLYDVMFKLDARQFNVILCDCPDDTMEWAGIIDRLSRASGT